jgi:hypothetical protein
MSETVYEVPGLVTVSKDPASRSILVRWGADIYREDGAVRVALEAALDCVRQHGLTNWVADVSAVTSEMATADAQYAAGEFVDALGSVGLDVFVLVAAPSQDSGASELEMWLEETHDRLNGRVEMFLATTLDQAHKLIVARG